MPTLRSLILSYDVRKTIENFPPPALKNNIKLVSLKLIIRSSWLMNSCKKMILQSPGLRTLVVKIHFMHDLWDDAYPDAFCFEGKETFPPLRVLTLERYDTRERSLNGGVGAPECIGNRLQAAKLEELALVKCNASRLTTCCRKLRTSEIRLKALTVYKCKVTSPFYNFEKWHHYFNGFLRSFQGLENLTLVDAAVDLGCLLGGITHHGQSLQHLTFHQSDFGRTTHFFPRSIQYICDGCRNLRSLSLDFYRSLDGLGFVSHCSTML